MTIKPRKRPAPEIHAEADALANELAERPYGSKTTSTRASGRIVRTSISLDEAVHQALEDYCITNKRTGGDLKTVSAIIRVAVDDFMKKYKISTK